VPRSISDKVVIVIATYNEAATISDLLRNLSCYQVVVVDDSSPDGTGDLANAFAHVTVLGRPHKMGLASAYDVGFRRALTFNPYYVIQMDAGGTHPPDRVPLLIERAGRLNLGLVIGSRFLQGRRWLSYRSGISWCATALMRLLRLKVSDATSGFRCWQASTLSAILSRYQQPTVQGHAFQIEMLFRAWEIGTRIGEIPIPYCLTNSTFRWSMVWEGLRTWCRLAWDHVTLGGYGL